TDFGTGSIATGSVYQVDALLGGFQVWGSGPPGFMPLNGSPALEAADPTAAPPVDQRGVARPIGAGPDIGAMETSVMSYAIAGVVLRQDQGLPGIRVFVGSREEITDEAGRFRFDALPS